MGSATPHLRRRFPVAAYLVLLACLCGCSRREPINDTYGKRLGNSVNGTGVLAEMFKQSGRSVSSWRRLSPRLEKVQVIVWAPDNFRCPPLEQTNYLNNWLRNGRGRTLIYIARDYDASIDYWREMRDRSTAADSPDIQQRLAKARSRVIAANGQNQDDRTCAWFRLEQRATDQIAGRLGGDWAADLGETQAQLPLTARTVLPKPVETEDGESIHEFEINTLLTVGDEPFITRIAKENWTASQILLVANGSTFLNLPLVRHENRVLAARLIAECSGDGPVTFLESGERGLMIANSDKSESIMWQIFTVSPLNYLALHATFLGILYCFTVCPIFGKPRRLNRDNISDFGKHIAAVGELLQSTNNAQYAHTLINHYHDAGRGKSLASVPVR